MGIEEQKRDQSRGSGWSKVEGIETESSFREDRIYPRKNIINGRTVVYGDQSGELVELDFGDIEQK